MCLPTRNTSIGASLNSLGVYEALNIAIGNRFTRFGPLRSVN